MPRLEGHPLGAEEDGWCEQAEIDDSAREMEAQSVLGLWSVHRAQERWRPSKDILNKHRKVSKVVR